MTIKTFEQYLPYALRTAKPLTDDMQIKHAVLGMIGETGEVADNIKRHVIYDGKFDPVNLMEECGDLFWYLALYIHTTGRNGRLVDAVIADDVKVSKGKEILINTCLNLADLTSAFHTTQGSNDLKLICGTAGALKTLLVASGYTVEQALNRNIEKLAQRYGDRYTDYLALNRDTAAELAVLKGEASV